MFKIKTAPQTSANKLREANYPYKHNEMFHTARFSSHSRLPQSLEMLQRALLGARFPEPPPRGSEGFREPAVRVPHADLPEAVAMAWKPHQT